MSKFLKFLLIYFIATVAIVKGDETLDLTCTSNKDCDSFEDKKVESNCRDGKCVCNVRRSEKEELVPCVPRTTSSPRLGDPEPVNVLTCPCTLPNYECKNGKICDCKAGFTKIDGKCMQSVILLGKSCESIEQCKAFDKLSECNEEERICKCAKQFTEMESTCRSMVTKSGRSTCKATDECHENEECITGKCVCKKDFIAVETNNTVQCEAVAHFGEKCEEDVQCEMGLGVGSTCYDKQCICSKSHTKAMINGRIVCKRHILVGDACNNHNECVPYKEEAMMTCRNNKCVCASDYELFDAYTRRCARKSDSRSSSGHVKSPYIFSVLISVSMLAILFK